jgi:EipB-like
MSLKRILCFAPVVAFGVCATLATAQTVPQLRSKLTPHRAVYDIALARTDQGSGVSSADGKMVFEVTGNACEGYKMRQRMLVNIGDDEGNVGLLDFRITTFESGDGDVYSFDSRTTVNQEVVEAVEGEARRSGGNIEVSLKQPTEKTVTLDGGVLFPSQHLEAILDAARADRKFLSANIYEGAGTGETTDEAAAAIGEPMPATDAPLRSGVRHWPVSVGYFDPATEGGSASGLGEELPSYQMSFTLYENGVTNDLVMDYGNYALSGSLKTIEPLASADCASR